MRHLPSLRSVGCLVSAVLNNRFLVNVIYRLQVSYCISAVRREDFYFIGIQLIFLYLVGLIALYTGLILWRLYIRLDSIKYPLKTYADIAERILGKTARHVCTVLQSLQLVVNVGTHLDLTFTL